MQYAARCATRLDVRVRPGIVAYLLTVISFCLLANLYVTGSKP